MKRGLRGLLAIELRIKVYYIFETNLLIRILKQIIKGNPKRYISNGELKALLYSNEENILGEWLFEGTPHTHLLLLD